MATGSTVGAQTAGAADSAGAWRELQSHDEIQFAPLEIPEVPPPEPTWFDKLIAQLADFFAPVGRFIAESWPVLRWVLLAAFIAAVAWFLYRTFGPQGVRSSSVEEDELEAWRPDEKASIALLEEADRLAAEGRYDEATHLLLQRSVGHIADAHPGWVEPSSTARELATLELLSDAARGAFGTIAERVERSLFALRTLDSNDWQVAREAYASFALVRLERRTS